MASSTAKGTYFRPPLTNIIIMFYFVSTYRERYHIDPVHHHPQAAKIPQVSAAHNRVIYRARDVEYAKILGRCRSGNSTRLRLVQVRAKNI